MLKNSTIYYATSKNKIRSQQFRQILTKQLKAHNYSNINKKYIKEQIFVQRIKENRTQCVHFINKDIQKTKNVKLQYLFMQIVLQDWQCKYLQLIKNFQFIDSKNYLPQLISYFNIVSFDCSGSGLSDGNYVTLGYKQKEDLLAVINQLKQKYSIKEFILWGRSMGAVSALLYAAKYKYNQDISSLVIDNAFSDLFQICKQLKDQYLSILPDFFIQSLIDYTQQYINQNINPKQNFDFNIKKLKPKKIVNEINCPIFYIYSQKDTIVNNKHTKLLYQLSNQPKKIIPVKGDHNCPRDTQVKNKVVQHLRQLAAKRVKSPKSKKSIQISNNQQKFASFLIQNVLYSQQPQSLPSKIPIISNLQVLEHNTNDQQTQIGLVYDSPFSQELCSSYSSFKNVKDFPCPKQQKHPNRLYKIKSYEQVKKEEEKQYGKIEDLTYKSRKSFGSSQKQQKNIQMDQSKKRKRKKIFDL